MHISGCIGGIPGFYCPAVLETLALKCPRTGCIGLWNVFLKGIAAFGCPAKAHWCLRRALQSIPRLSHNMKGTASAADFVTAFLTFLRKTTYMSPCETCALGCALSLVACRKTSHKTSRPFSGDQWNLLGRSGSPGRVRKSHSPEEHGRNPVFRKTCPATRVGVLRRRVQLVPDGFHRLRRRVGLSGIAVCQSTQQSVKHSKGRNAVQIPDILSIP